MTLAHAIGNGVADDEAINPFVPEMIRFYLAEEAILGEAPTYQCSRDEERRYLVDRLGELVVESVNEAGATAC